MPRFSKRSEAKLATCDPKLQQLFNEVIKGFDCSILVGHRGQFEQAKAVIEGRSKVHWPNSKHNSSPSQAVDVAPYPIDWEDRERFHLFAGYVLGIASQLNIPIRWGGDWDMDTEVKDNTFDDLVHFELASKPPTQES